MTGIDRLHKLIADIDVSADPELWYILRRGTEGDWDYEEHDDKTLDSTLAAIADQIEREHAEDCFRMGERAAEEYEAIAWVREHGGLSHVKDIYHDLRAVVERIGVEWSESELHGLMDALDRRLMPEGVEWMLWDDGKPVTYDDAPDDVIGAYLALDGSGYVLMTDLPDQLMSEPSERVKRPAPKVLDADGVEISVGDTVYLLPGDWCGKFPCLGYHGGEELEVFSLHASHVEGGIGCRDTRRPKGTCYPQPSQLTHRAPVLAADNEPLEVGQTVWNVEDGTEWCVTKVKDSKVFIAFEDFAAEECDPSLLTHQRPVLDADGVPIREGDTVCPKYPYEDPDRQVESAEVVYVHRLGRIDIQAKYATGMSFRQQVDAKQLTHTKPEPRDSWECIEEDATLSPEVYCHRNGIDISQKDGTEIFLADTVEPMARDLVRRCRALAERERGE